LKILYNNNSSLSFCILLLLPPLSLSYLASNVLTPVVVVLLASIGYIVGNGADIFADFADAIADFADFADAVGDVADIFDAIDADFDLAVADLDANGSDVADTIAAIDADFDLADAVADLDANGSDVADTIADAADLADNLDAVGDLDADLDADLDLNAVGDFAFDADFGADLDLNAVGDFAFDADFGNGSDIFSTIDIIFEDGNAVADNLDSSDNGFVDVGNGSEFANANFVDVGNGFVDVGNGSEFANAKFLFDNGFIDSTRFGTLTGFNCDSLFFLSSTIKLSIYKVILLILSSTFVSIIIFAVVIYFCRSSIFELTSLNASVVNLYLNVSLLSILVNILISVKIIVYIRKYSLRIYL